MQRIVSWANVSGCLEKRKEDSEAFEKIVLREEGLSRVADVQPGDFDSDGDTDLLIGILDGGRPVRFC